MTTATRVAVAIAAGLIVTALSRIPADWAPYALAPGIFLSQAVGAGSLHEPGPLGIGFTVLLFYVGSVVAWALVAYIVLAMSSRRRAA